MAKELELYLEPDGFYAGYKLKNGKLGAGAHKITEDEIITMFTKTGREALIIHGQDGKSVIAKIVAVQEQQKKPQ